MTVEHKKRIALFEAQERRIVLPAFGPEMAWRLGRILADRAVTEGKSLLIDIRRGDFILFRAVLGDVTLDQQVWAERKAAVVHRMEASSALVEARLALAEVDAVAIGWLGHDYALTGGSFPIRVKGAGVVATATVSGLTSEEDHAFVVAGLEQLLDSNTPEA